MEARYQLRHSPDASHYLTPNWRSLANHQIRVWSTSSRRFSYPGFSVCSAFSHTRWVNVDVSGRRGLILGRVNVNLEVRGRPVTVSIDRLKPSYSLEEQHTCPNRPVTAPAVPSPPIKTTRSGRRVQFPKRYLTQTSFFTVDVVTLPHIITYCHTLCNQSLFRDSGTTDK